MTTQIFLSYLTKQDINNYKSERFKSPSNSHQVLVDIKNKDKVSAVNNFQNLIDEKAALGNSWGGLSRLAISIFNLRKDRSKGLLQLNINLVKKMPTSKTGWHF